MLQSHPHNHLFLPPKDLTWQPLALTAGSEEIKAGQLFPFPCVSSQPPVGIPLCQELERGGWGLFGMGIIECIRKGRFNDTGYAEGIVFARQRVPSIITSPGGSPACHTRRLRRWRQIFVPELRRRVRRNSISVPSYSHPASPLISKELTICSSNSPY